MSEGSRIRESWLTALSDAQARFRSLLSSPSSDWKRLPVPGPGKPDGTVSYTPKAKTRGAPTILDVAVHRRSGKDGEVFRAMLDVQTDEDALTDLDNWKTVLQTPEVRKSWDPIVEGSHLVELLDPDTRISKTEFTLGWPANPRDAITIARTFSDSSTLIDISTSLPRSSDDPAYLRPSPPYVRSNVRLSSWCIQFQPPATPSDAASKSSNSSRIRIICFWQHDLNAVWGMAGLGIGQHLPTLLVGLVDTVREKGDRIPRFIGYGLGISVFSVMYGEAGREALVLEYAIILPEDDEIDVGGSRQKSLEDIRSQKDKRRLERTIELGLPATHGWDIQISVKAPSEETAAAPWTVRAGRLTLPDQTTESSRLILRLTHPRPPNHHIVGVKVVAELAGGNRGIRINSVPREIETFEPRDPISFGIDSEVLGDVSSVQGISIQTSGTNLSAESITSAQTNKRLLIQTATERSPAAEKSILTLVRRNYIYFTSLLQEPEAKWKPITESRGVTVTQLDSIDPTLVVYRAEAVFVGVSLWDLFSTIDTPGARVNWDKTFEDANMLEDVNELTDLWHFRTRAVWPASARDAILLKTSYKSSSSAHIFAFSTDDTSLFSSIPTPEPAVIRSQVDLQGWAIEALSPTTTQVTLLDQSDPKGWSNKAYIPQQMIASVAGIGEFAIKQGSPPVIVRLGGARVNRVKYEHDKGVFRLEYEGSEQRRGKVKSAEVDRLKHVVPSRSASVTPRSSVDEDRPGDSDIPLVVHTQPASSIPKIECEVRIDADSWASHVEIVVDPPPMIVSCLRRHRLASEGGGLWVTIEHDAIFVEGERLLTQVRKVPGPIKEKAVVTVNGARVKVDILELSENEVKQRSRKKRVKPSRMPLDQPPVTGVIRRRRLDDDESEGSGSETVVQPKPVRMSMQPITSPLAKFWTMAVEQATTTTSAAAAAASAAMAPTPASLITTESANPVSPMQVALQALTTLQALHNSPPSDWSRLSDSAGLLVSRKLDSNISPSIAVHRAEKVFEGVAADDVASLVTDLSCRKQWDDRLESAAVLDEYGFGCSTAFLSMRTSFPFSNRGFYIASTTARVRGRQLTITVEDRELDASAGISTPPHSPLIIYHATATIAESALSPRFSVAKVNPTGLAVGDILIQGWVMETLDPYTTENYAIPSTRVIQFTAIDFAGSLPVAVNSMINGTLPRAVLGLQTAVKTQAPMPSLRWPGRGFVIGDDDKSKVGTDGWVLSVADAQRVNVVQSYSVSEKTFRCAVIIKPQPPPTRSRSPSPLERTPTMNSLRLVEPSTPSKGLSAESSSVPFPSAPSTPVGTLRGDGPNGSPYPPRPQSRRVSVTSRSLSRPSPYRGSRSGSNAMPWAGAAKLAMVADFVVAELVLNPELYGSLYRVEVSSELLKGGEEDRLLALPVDGDDLVRSMKKSAVEIQTSAYTLPPSPLHSHSLDPSTSNPPTKHLLRFTLPTGPYYAPQIQDPLNGTESEEKKERPSWLTELEERGAITWITLHTSDTAKGGKISVGGKVLDVMNEKDSLAIFGTEELEDDRTGKMAILKRSSTLDGNLPAQLRKPLAVARHLCEDPAPEAAPADANFPASEDASQNPTSTELIKSDASSVLEVAEAVRPAAPNTILGFFSSASRTTLFHRLTPAIGMPSFISAPLQTRSPPSAASSRRPSLTRLRSRSAQAQAQTWEQMLQERSYSLKFVLVAALIAFLLGSLIRSLLSPADFMYFPTRGGEAEPEGSGGWREVKRLVEVKWVLWGWDAVIFAVVRR